MGRPSKKSSKRYVLLQRMNDARFEELRKEKKLARDVSDLLNDVVNNISIEQMPSTDHPHTEHNYTVHSTNGSVGSPSDCLTRRTIGTQTYFKEIFEPPKLRPREAIINGRRIIDFQYFFNELKDASSHSKSLCNLNNMIITKEEKNGISTSYSLKCLVCNFEKVISSESPYRDTNLNADFVSGILSIEWDFMDAYILLAQMHLPLLSNDEFIQECKNVCLTMDKKTQQTLLKTHQDASRNLKKELQKRTLSKKLAALKQTFCEQENAQKEHPLTTTQKCSSVSDNSNIERESQQTTMKLSSSARENIQGKFQLTTLKQNSAHTNIQTESQLANMKQSSACENIQTEHKLVTKQQCSSTSNNSNLLEQMHLGGLLVKDEFEIKEENVIHYENEFETIVPDQKRETSDSKLIAGPEQVMLNTITIKQEIDSDDENFSKSVTDMTNRENIIMNDEQIKEMLTQANEGRTSENTMVENNKDNMLVKHEFYDKEITDKKSDVLYLDIYNNPDSELPLKKARTVTYKKSNNSKDAQKIPTIALNRRKNVFQSKFKSNRPVTGTTKTKDMRNEVATSSITNVRNATATVSVTTAGGENVMFSIPVKFNENGALIISQNPHDKASGTHQGDNGTTSSVMPGKSSVIQQPASKLNVVPIASTATCVSLQSIAVQQPMISSNAMSKVSDSLRK